mmetsp:Transcript_27984/g.80289  ORF Transcript_27984/g.80289 Transcript_27984/m.80289 type:complete len:175 (-) Transcript_27984:75-599(-)
MDGRQPLLRWHTGANVRGNPVVQCKNQEREDPTQAMESSRRAEAERLARRALRLAEGGRGGGLYDRQEASDRRQWVDDSGYDDFGRRINKPAAPAEGAARGVESTAVDGGAAAGGKALSREERRQAALERLRRRQGAGGAHAAGSTGSGTAEGGEGRSRSRSPATAEPPAPAQE